MYVDNIVVLPRSLYEIVHHLNIYCDIFCMTLLYFPWYYRTCSNCVTHFGVFQNLVLQLCWTFVSLIYTRGIGCHKCYCLLPLLVLDTKGNTTSNILHKFILRQLVSFKIKKFGNLWKDCSLPCQQNLSNHPSMNQSLYTVGSDWSCLYYKCWIING